jgi:RNA polymerase sigma factor (TIGR02999 family)
MAHVDRDGLDLLFAAAYDELRRLAAQVRTDHPGATLEPTALVHEAWVKLARHPDFEVASPLHFRRIVGRAMRQVLVEAARARTAAKRGGPDTVLVTFDESVEATGASADRVVALDDALHRLAQRDPRQAAVVEARYFAGMEVADVAAALEISEATVLRDWRAARAWLAVALGDAA